MANGQRQVNNIEPFVYFAHPTLYPSVLFVYCAKPFVIHHFNGQHHPFHRQIHIMFSDQIHLCLEKSNNHSTSHNHFHMKQLQIQTDCSYCNCHTPICILYSKLQFFFISCVYYYYSCLFVSLLIFSLHLFSFFCCLFDAFSFRLLVQLSQR